MNAETARTENPLTNSGVIVGLGAIAAPRMD